MASKYPVNQHILTNQSLRDHFLIAMPGLQDSIFSHTVTYICDHSEHGAMGIVLNQPLNIQLSEVFDHLSMKYDPAVRDVPVLSGGPVNSQQGFVLHRKEGEWDSTLSVTPEICLTASRDIVKAMAESRAPKGALFVLGYAGWSAGQLESEISSNSWLTLPADSSIIFDTPAEERWAAATKAFSFDFNLISASAGHA
ncbi:hypothetical protein TDB9533_03851 [Thalassocella blandensis]|nr:hypothetical protein TDB9533_03851 [Thalassocella blandensis]